MKWYTEIFNKWGSSDLNIVFRGILDTPVYMYNFRTRYALATIIDEYARKYGGQIITLKALDELCWKLDCTRESDKQINNLGKEKTYFLFWRDFRFPPKKYIPKRAFFFAPSFNSCPGIVSFYDGNERREWLKNHEKELKTTSKFLEADGFGKILENFPSDKTLIREVIKEYFDYYIKKTVRNRYEFLRFINIYYTFYYEPKKRNSSGRIGYSMD